MSRAGVATFQPTDERPERAAGAEPAPDALDAVLALLRERDGVDLTGYRRATVGRRVENRMTSAGAATHAEYLERLRTDPAEASRLLERVTIKVSRFFRNRRSVEIVGRALDGLAPARPLSVWSAGCGRGEEPYTLAILLAELGQGAGAPPPVLATDIDPGALEAGRRAAYPPDALVELPRRIRERWIVAARGAAFGVAPEIRARVTFERHDLARDGVPRRAPFDLVSCRNTLIYFDAPLQRRALGVLCDALAPGGLLWLGEAEWPTADAARRLVLVNPQARLFRLAEGRRRA